MLKVNFPDAETEHEADALAFWPNDASVALLDSSAERRALLVERCEPGTQLWELTDGQALEVAGDVLSKLWRAGDPGTPFRRLADEAPVWVAELAKSPFPPDLRGAALDALHELPQTQGEPVLCNEDFHGGNVILSGRGWLAIDVKPLVAEREFSVVSLVRDRRPVDAAAIARRLDALAQLGLDRERMRRWSLVHALWWGSDDVTGEPHSKMVEAARLLLDADLPD